MREEGGTIKGDGSGDGLCVADAQHKCMWHGMA